jgi:hypothetical protein
MRDPNTGVFFWRLGPNFVSQSSFQRAPGAHYQPHAGDFNGDGIWEIGMRDPTTGTFFWRLGPTFVTNQSIYNWVPNTNYQALTVDLR